MTAAAAAQDTIRAAQWTIELERKGPGQLLRDIRRGTSDDLLAARAALREIDADIVLLAGFDTDFDGTTVEAFADFVDAGYDFTFTSMGNTGAPSGFDLDRDGRFGEAENSLSFGRFRGEGGMALLSRFPIDLSGVTRLTGTLWATLPESRFPHEYFDQEEAARLTVSSRGHWIVPISVGSVQLSVLAYYANGPVFDGPEDRNGRRNGDETALWRHVLDGRVGAGVEGPFVLMGNANLDPEDGEGYRGEIRALLAHPRLQDPMPTSTEGPDPNPAHRGDPRRDTADWTDPDPGNLRVDYVLPSRDLTVLDRGILWVHEPRDAPFRHGLVWVDIAPIP